MEFYYSSDEEINVDYEKYQHTPYTDPSVIKKFWRQHFSRKPNNRNPEVTRAFEMKCSLHQFMHPELSCEEVRSNVLDDVRVQPSSTTNKTHLLVQNTSAFSQSIIEESQQRLASTSKKQKKQDEVSESSNICTNDQKPLKPKKTKTSKKTIVSKNVKIDTSQIVSTKVDFNTKISDKSRVKHIRRCEKDSSDSSKTVFEGNLTNKAITCNNVYIIAPVKESINSKKNIINTAKPKVSKRNSSKTAVKPKLSHGSLVNLTSLGILKSKKMGFNNGITDLVNTTKF